MASFDMSIEYLRGIDNKVANMLSRAIRLEKNSMAPRAETNKPRLVQHAKIMEEDFVIHVWAIADEEPSMRRLQQADWPMLQWYDPVIWHVMDLVSLPPVGQVLLRDYLRGRSPTT